MKAILDKLINHQALGREEARQVLLEVTSGKHNASQMSAFMTVYMMRAISLHELGGFREAMLEVCRPVQLDRPAMDVCGTGGDGKNTFNISTLSAFVVAGAGQPVAKHGNYGVSSVSGSSNVMEYFGFRFSADADKLQKTMDKTGMMFMHAPLFHPAMKNVAPIRKELGVKTFFNMLGPMVNPASPPRQLVGVFSLELARHYAYLYQGLGKSFVILHDLQGYDEVSLTGPVKVYSNEGEMMVRPSDFGLSEVSPESIRGGATVEASAEIFMSVLKGEGTRQQTDVVLANAALSLYAAGVVKTLPDGVALAGESLLSGKAFRKFEAITALSTED
ncbi:MAG: anthranilate phosphoribosyltransferase [Bacteroidota bacterium]